jgi:hypothetical protein
MNIEDLTFDMVRSYAEECREALARRSFGLHAALATEIAGRFLNLQVEVSLAREQHADQIASNTPRAGNPVDALTALEYSCTCRT